METKASFAGLTEPYARWRSSRVGQVTDRLEQALLADLLGPVSGRMLLDVGCGDGAMASRLARQGALVAALDSEAAMIAAARRRRESEAAHYWLVTGRAENLPFADATFDRVIAVTVLCFVRDGAQAVREIARVLKPGGRLVIGELGRFSLWAAWRRVRGWLGNPTWQIATFRTARALRALAQAAGLNVLDVRGAVHYPPWGVAAELLAPIDLWLGRRSALGSAFIAMSAIRPAVTDDAWPQPE